MTLKYLDNDPYYSQVPTGFKPAVLDDFYLQNHLVMNKPYLIHSETKPGIYWPKRTKPGFMDHNDFYNFLDKGRIYINNNLKTKTHE